MADLTPSAAAKALMRAGSRHATLPKPPKMDVMPPAEPFPVFLRLSSRDVPWIDEWKVGETYTLVIRAHLDSMETTQDAPGKTETVARLTVREIAEPKQDRSGIRVSGQYGKGRMS